MASCNTGLRGDQVLNEEGSVERLANPRLQDVQRTAVMCLSSWKM